MGCPKNTPDHLAHPLLRGITWSNSQIHFTNTGVPNQVRYRESEVWVCRRNRSWNLCQCRKFKFSGYSILQKGNLFNFETISKQWRSWWDGWLPAGSSGSALFVNIVCIQVCSVERVNEIQVLFKDRGGNSSTFQGRNWFKHFSWKGLKFKHFSFPYEPCIPYSKSNS